MCAQKAHERRVTKPRRKRGRASLMARVDPAYGWRRLRRWNVEVDHDRLLSAAHQHALERLVGAGVDLLVGNVRRDEDKIARAGFSHVLEALAPAHSSPPLDHVDDAFQFA